MKCDKCREREASWWSNKYWLCYECAEKLECAIDDWFWREKI